jgi:hypothetical protein
MPSFESFQAMDELGRGHLLANVMVMLARHCLGEIDRQAQITQ